MQCNIAPKTVSVIRTYAFHKLDETGDESHNTISNRSGKIKRNSGGR